MIKVILFLILSLSSFSNNKLLIPTLSKNGEKQLIITLKPKIRFYIVKKGDTLEGIAKRFRMTVKELARRNNRDIEGILRIGEVLQVDEVENT